MSSADIPHLYIPNTPPKIRLQDVYHYLGYGKSTPDSASETLVKQCADTLLATVKPRVLYACYSVCPKPDGIWIEECRLFLPGQDIAAHLDGCHQAILFCATLSVQADALIRRTQVSDMTAGLMMDCCATAVVEQLCDDAEAVMKAPHLHCCFTSRFSPGYGDLPLSIQKEFLTILDAPRKIGLCTTDSSILTPRKSVTAIIGISKAAPTHQRTGCAHCALAESCEFKRKGEFCGLSNTVD